MEGENPTRRYKSFRPRQAARGLISPSGSNSTTACLYNNSTAAQILVVRDIVPYANSAPYAVVTSYQQGLLGTKGGLVTPLWPGEAALPGVLTNFDTATAFTGDYALPIFQVANGYAFWTHNFPFAIIPPNWSLVVQDGTNRGIYQVSFMWEAVFPDELDFLFDF